MFYRQTNSYQPGVAEGLDCNRGQTVKLDNQCILDSCTTDCTTRPTFIFEFEIIKIDPVNIRLIASLQISSCVANMGMLNSLNK